MIICYLFCYLIMVFCYLPNVFCYVSSLLLYLFCYLWHRDLQDELISPEGWDIRTISLLFTTDTIKALAELLDKMICFEEGCYFGITREMGVSDILTGEDFYQQQYGAMFTAMAELYAEGQPVDLVTLQNRLRENGVPEELCSVEYISELVNAVPTSANVKYYANIVSDKATLRRMIRLNDPEITPSARWYNDLEAFA